jgi:hypothetical protein
MNYGLRGGLGVEYDAEGFPIEDPANTTYTGTTGTSLGQQMGPPVPFTTSPLSWLNANSTIVTIGAAVLGLILFAAKGRR